MGQTRPLFVYFRPFLNTNTVQILSIKELKVCLGHEPGEAGW